MKKLIDNFIEESNKYGFHINKKENEYKCTTKCLVCNKNFTQDIKINIVNVNNEDRIQCSLPVYCDRCTKITNHLNF